MSDIEISRDAKKESISKIDKKIGVLEYLET